MDVKERVVVITGGSSGIGKETAKLLAGKGAKLALLARDRSKLDAALKEFGGGQKVIAVQADVTDRSSVDKAVAQVLSAYGAIDILINSAGVGHFGPVIDMTEEKLVKLLRTNILGPIFMVQASIEHLKKSQGMIVNISSGLSKRALPYLSVYGGTKAMLDHISDGLRMELRDDGIKVLNYCPPATDTPFLDASHTNERSRISDHTKLAKPQDVAGRIVRAIEGDKREAIEGNFLKYMNFFAPKVLDNMFYKAMVKKQK